MGNNIQAYKHSGIPEYGALASDDDRDDVYDEVETSAGVILKFPSAVSIEARGFGKQSSSIYGHSRAPSVVRPCWHLLLYSATIMHLMSNQNNA